MRTVVLALVAGLASYPPFRDRVRALLAKRWGKPGKRGRRLVWSTGKGRALAEDTGTSWDLELSVRVPPPTKPAKP